MIPPNQLPSKRRATISTSRIYLMRISRREERSGRSMSLEDTKRSTKNSRKERESIKKIGKECRGRSIT